MTSKVELQDRWIAALRSGKYEQVPGRLTRLKRTGRGYCCLGVACDIYDPDGWQTKGEVTYLGQKHYLPVKVGNAYGMDTDNPSIEINSQEAASLGLCPVGAVTLSSLNDVHGWTFNKIADFIEKYRDRIFK